MKKELLRCLVGIASQSLERVGFGFIRFWVLGFRFFALWGSGFGTPGTCIVGTLVWGLFRGGGGCIGILGLKGSHPV